MGSTVFFVSANYALVPVVSLIGFPLTFVAVGGQCAVFGFANRTFCLVLAGSSASGASGTIGGIGAAAHRAFMEVITALRRPSGGELMISKAVRCPFSSTDLIAVGALIIILFRVLAICAGAGNEMCCIGNLASELMVTGEGAGIISIGSVRIILGIGRTS